jgi:hypothetical protein
MSKPTDLVQGTLDLLILKVLALEPLNGALRNAHAAFAAHALPAAGCGDSHTRQCRGVEQRRAESDVCGAVVGCEGDERHCCYGPDAARPSRRRRAA